MARTRLRFAIALTALTPILVTAQNPPQDPQPTTSGLWRFCPPEPMAELLTVAAPTDDQTPVRIEADAIEAERPSAVLEGEVTVTQGERRVTAPVVNLDRTANRVQAEDLTFATPDFALQSKAGEYDLGSGMGSFSEAEFYLRPQHARGSAAKVEVDRTAVNGRLTDLTYTTCARGAEFWRIEARELKLDQATGRGTVSDATLSIKQLPVAYLPYLSFPIDGKRHSGWLPPRLGYDSEGGVDLRVPYYWNIAPNQDATFFPRIVSKRGLMLGAEYRYLGHWHSGEAQLEYLPHDRRFDDHRSAIRIDHRANPLPGLFTDLLFQRVSDDDYIDDLSNNLELLSPNYLERRFDLRYGRSHWNVLARAQEYQTLSDTVFDADDQPYERLPQLLFNGRWPLGSSSLHFALRAEAVRFDIDDKDRVTGERVDLYPAFELPLERPWGFLRPRLAYRYTDYRLDNTTDGADRPDRGTPIVSLDSGLFLERPLTNQWLGAVTQTLEPRLFYLHVPLREQDSLPLFDTSEIDPGLASLFLHNRFTGADRQGDANQISAAVTSRLLTADDGSERARVSVGQAYFFGDPQVTLEGSEMDDQGHSDVFVEAAYRFDSGVSLRGAMQWDTDRQNTERSAIDLRYRLGEGRQLNLGHRYASEELEQLDLSFLWTIDEKWRTVGRWNYSLKENNTIDAFAGLEYGDCCWAVRLLARHHRDQPEDQNADNSFYLEFELKGLSGVGNRIDQLLEESIFGYKPISYE